MDQAFAIAYQNYLLSAAWRDKREHVFKHKGKRCNICKSEDNIRVHHLTYDMLGKERLSDLVPLCKSCHDLVHKLGGGYIGYKKLKRSQKKKDPEYQAKVEKRNKRREAKRRSGLKKYLAEEAAKQEAAKFKPVTIIRKGYETIRKEG